MARRNGATLDSGLASTLRISVMRLGRRLRSERSSEGLSLSQLSVLGTIDREGPLTPTQLATRERVQPPSMSRVVAALDQMGLVRRAAHETDRRQCLIELTAQGRALLAEDRSRREAWLAQRLDELSATEREALRAVAPILDRLADA
jgi:DNA-binding MarR family transcriptional regulator